MNINPSQGSVNNYLAPAGGTMHAVTFEGIFDATGQTVDWRQFKIDNFPFQPQGVFIDNSAGTAPLVIVIGPLNWTVSCPAGATTQAQFPAPNGQTATMTGAGQATVVFVDFPVLPAQNLVTIAGITNVAITGQPIGVSVPINDGGIPYDVQEIPTPISAVYGSIAPAATTVTLIPPSANLNLRKAVVTFSGNAVQGVAGTILLTLTLNGNAIYKENVFIPAAGFNENAYQIILDFAKLGLSAGAGNLVVTLASALTAGIVDVNAYFG